MAAHSLTPPRPLSRAWELLRADRRELVIIVLFALFSSILALVIPVGIEALVTTVTFGVALWPIVWLAVIMLFCLGLAAIIIAAETAVVELLQQRIFLRVAGDFAQRLLRARLADFERENGPSLLNRFFEVATLQKSVATLALDGTRLALATLVGLIVLGFYHPLLLFFSLGLIVLLVIMVLLGHGGVHAKLEESRVAYEMADWLEDLARHPRLFKTGAGPTFALQRTDTIAREWIDRRRDYFRVAFRQVAFGLLIYVAASVLLLGLGGYLVIQQQLTLGQLVAAELIVALIVGSFTKFGKYLDNWYGLCKAMEKIGQVTDLTLERGGGEILPNVDQGMRLQWKLKPDEPPAIDIASGECVAVIDRSSHQSILVDQLVGLRECDRATIEIDGRDWRGVDLAAGRAQIVLIQNVEIFAASVRENLCLGAAIDDADLRAALQAVGLVERIQALPGGLQSHLHPDGWPLSSDERLAFGVARALIQRPRLVVLDGVLDRLDRKLANRLLEAIVDQARPWTLLIFTRDEIVARSCQRVVTLSGELP